MEIIKKGKIKIKIGVLKFEYSYSNYLKFEYSYSKRLFFLQKTNFPHIHNVPSWVDVYSVTRASPNTATEENMYWRRPLGNLDF